MAGRTSYTSSSNWSECYSRGDQLLSISLSLTGDSTSKAINADVSVQPWKAKTVLCAKFETAGQIYWWYIVYGVPEPEKKYLFTVLLPLCVWRTHKQWIKVNHFKMCFFAECNAAIHKKCIDKIIGRCTGTAANSRDTVVCNTHFYSTPCALRVVSMSQVQCLVVSSLWALLAVFALSLLSSACFIRSSCVAESEYIDR